MKKIFSNTFIIAIVLFLIFRISLYFFGWVEDGNFLILVIFPILVFLIMTQIAKYIFNYINS